MIAPGISHAQQFYLFPFVRLRNVAAAALAGIAFCTSPAQAGSAPETNLRTTVNQLEDKLQARVGVLVRDRGSDWQWGAREDERFLMASTFKSLLCGAVLDRVDQGELSLNEQVPIKAADIVPYAPITEKHLGKTLSIHDLCLATLDISDNTAANLLINRLGGPQEVTQFLRRLGDPVTRLDRMEPDLNVFVPEDPRDTTSPSAMLSSWERLLLGNALTPKSRQQLATWMSHGGVTGALMRAEIPKGWLISDKSGGGRHHTRNLVAMVTPPEHAPYFVAIFVSDTPASWSDRNAAVREISAAVIELIKTR